MIQALLINGDERKRAEWAAIRTGWRADPGTILWLDVAGTDAAEMDGLAEALGLHPAVVRACLHPEHRARVKSFKGHLLMVLNAVGRTGSEKKTSAELGRWRTLELNVITGDRWLLTVHPDPVPAVALLWQRQSRDGEGPGSLEYLLYSLCEDVITGYYHVLDRIDQQIDEVEDLILEEVTGKAVIDRLFALKRHVLYLRRVLGPQRDALGGLMRRETANGAPDGHGYFLDIYEHSLRLFDLLDTYRDLISSSLDAYLSTVSNRMNRVMQTLTIVSTIVLPLTLISGIFGMNLGGMPWGNTPWGFTIVMLFMLLIMGGLVLYFRRKKWM